MSARDLDAESEQGELIAAYLETYRLADPKDVLELSKGMAAGLLVGVATGKIPAPLSLRLRAASSIIDRTEGLPVTSILINDQRKVDYVMEGLAKLEQLARAHHEPMTLIAPMTSAEIGAREAGETPGVAGAPRPQASKRGRPKRDAKVEP